jgi:predicted HicB family RNase H-like nuclease
MKKQTQHDYKRLTTRYPPEVYAELQAAAERNGRSVNAEVIARVSTDQIAELRKEVAELKTIVKEVLANVRS